MHDLELCSFLSLIKIILKKKVAKVWGSLSHLHHSSTFLVHGVGTTSLKKFMDVKKYDLVTVIKDQRHHTKDRKRKCIDLADRNSWLRLEQAEMGKNSLPSSEKKLRPLHLLPSLPT